MMREMVGGCCVCSDERGWTENPLVYCDGPGCNVAVHQACYGIVSVPTGPWFCRKCESQERLARVRCELCPQKEGALKRTDTSGWCHVVCALFIPEAWFGNVQTMEPIILKGVPTDRFNKTCYICEEQCREGKASSGACMQCNKGGCKQHFHVTCAQGSGLLCEEQGSYMDNVKYCGYCLYHYKKLRKDGSVKTIPAYKAQLLDENRGIGSGPTGSGMSPEKPRMKLFARNSPSTEIRCLSGGETPVSPLTMNPAALSAKVVAAKVADQAANKSSVSFSSANEARVGRFTTANFTETTITPSPANLGDMTSPNSSVDKPSKAASPISPTPSSATSPASTHKFPITTEILQSTVTSIKSSISSKPINDIPTEENKEKINPPVPPLVLPSVLPIVDSTVTDNKEESDSLALELLGKRSRLKPCSEKLSQLPDKKKLKRTKHPLPPVKPKTVKDLLAESVPSLSPALDLASTAAAHSLAEAALSKDMSKDMPSLSSEQKLDDLKDEKCSYVLPPKPSSSKQMVSPNRQDVLNSSLPTSMEQLLERQWEQGSQFLMEQGQHFDIASLLNCLHQLRQENIRLEDHISSLLARRDHLLAVNARLSMPLLPSAGLQTPTSSDGQAGSVHNIPTRT